MCELKKIAYKETQEHLLENRKLKSNPLFKRIFG